MAKIEKTFNEKRFTYLCNGEVYKHCDLEVIAIQ